jgi:hypothetical protein
VRLWDLATGTELRRVGGPGDPLTGVACSPGGRQLAEVLGFQDRVVTMREDAFPVPDVPAAMKATTEGARSRANSLNSSFHSVSWRASVRRHRSISRASVRAHRRVLRHCLQ